MARTASRSTSQRFRGKVVLLAFGFSNCGEVCPITLATLAGARKKLGARRGERAGGLRHRRSGARRRRADAEIPGQLRSDLRRRRRHACRDRRGAEELRHLARRRRSYADGSYTIGHSSSIYMIDRAGRLARRDALRPHAPTTSCMTSRSCCASEPASASGSLFAAAARRGCSACSAGRVSRRISVPSRDELFEIPKGTYARRMAGDKVEILPSRIRLTLGLNDVLLLRNLDDVPQVFGPTIMMPGQSFRLPFEKAAELPIRVHRARQRADDHRRGAAAGDRRGRSIRWRAARMVGEQSKMKALKQALPSIIVIAVVVGDLVGRGGGHARARSFRRPGRWSRARSSWRATARCGSTSAPR